MFTCLLEDLIMLALFNALLSHDDRKRRGAPQQRNLISFATVLPTQSRHNAPNYVITRHTRRKIFVELRTSSPPTPSPGTIDRQLYLAIDLMMLSTPRSDVLLLTRDKRGSVLRSLTRHGEVFPV